MVIHAECSRMEIRSLLKTIKLDISKHQSKRSKPSLDLLDSFRLKIWRSTKSSGKFQESGKQRALQTDVSVWSESGWWQNHGIYKFLNAFKSRQQGSRPKCWIDRLQAVRRIEQATTRLRCPPWMEYQFQAKGKQFEKSSKWDFEKTGILFIVLSNQVCGTHVICTIAQPQKRSSTTFSIWGPSYGGTQDPFLF